VLDIMKADTGQQIVSCPTPQADNKTALDNGSLILPAKIAWSPDSKYVAETFLSKTQSLIVIWDASNCRQILGWQHVDIPFDVDWSPDGKYLAFANSDSTVQVFDIVQHKIVYTYHDPFQTDIYRLAWSPDGRRIATASYSSHTVEVWDAFDGTHLVIYQGHVAPVASLDWSPDSKFIASGSSEKQGDTMLGQVQIWNASNGQHVYTFLSHLSSSTEQTTVLAVSWSPNGQYIASATGSLGTNSASIVQIWKALP
jgi:WD40 repeat protein